MVNTVEQEKIYNEFMIFSLFGKHADYCANRTRIIYLFDVSSSKDPDIQEMVQFIGRAIGSRGDFGMVNLFSMDRDKVLDYGGFLVDDWFDNINPIVAIKIRLNRERWISAIMKNVVSLAHEK